MMKKVCICRRVLELGSDKWSECPNCGIVVHQKISEKTNKRGGKLPKVTFLLQAPKGIGLEKLAKRFF